ncbi:MAG: MATE family efflux transporter [Lachnospiraceae bacterium]|nr:MATE family efflux transporter [Lachnospiraceae bacterium]
MKNRTYFSRSMFYHSLIPAFISSVMLSIANIADALTVGNRIGENALAAIGIVTPIYMLYNIFGYGLATGASVLHARLVASGREDEARDLFAQIMGVSFIATVFIAAAGNLFLDQMLYLLGVRSAESELYFLCVHYARPILLCAPVFILNMLFYFYLRSDDDLYLATIGFTIGNTLDVVLNVIFVLMLGLGVTGAAWATCLAQTASVLIMLTHFIAKKKGVLGLTPLQFNLKKSMEVFALGASTSIRFLFQFLFLWIVNNLLLQSTEVDGALYVAVFDIVMNISYLGYALFDAAGDAIQPLAAAFHAERDSECLRDILKQGLLWGVGAGMTVITVLFLFAQPVATLFGIRDPESNAIAVQAIRWFCASGLFAGNLMVLARYYQSVGRQRLSAVLTGLRTAIILIPVAVILGFYQPQYIWIMFFVSDLVSLLIALVLIARYGTDRELNRAPIISLTMENSNHEIGDVIEKLGSFYEENGATVRQVSTLTMAVEEICTTTIANAFTGREDEYIQLTGVADDGRLILHIRNSAPRFNPLDMRMGKVSMDADEELLDSIGIMAVKKIANEFYFRRNDGFNMLTVSI